MNVGIRKTDVELLENLCDAAMRAGHTQTAIEGYALALRLRAALNPGKSKHDPEAVTWDWRLG